MLSMDYLVKDRPQEATDPALMALKYPSGDFRLNGRFFKPSLDYEGEKRPCVIIMHGFPGHEQFRDLAHTLRRVGFCVATFTFRGTWGSDGSYSFETLKDDAANVLAYIKENADSLGVKADSIYLCGHSMGGFTTMRMLAANEDFKGAVLIAPCDIQAVYSDPAAFDFLMNAGKPFLSFAEGKDIRVLYDECEAHQADWPFPALAEKIDPERPILLFGGFKDVLCPPVSHLDPMLKVAEARGLDLKYVTYDSDHCFQSVRMKIQEAVAAWLFRLETGE